MRAAPPGEEHMANIETRMKTALRAALVGTIGLSAAGTPSPVEAAEARTKVILNGELAPVTFNDGDSFRVLAGSYKGAKARLAGYNTLESFGAVHQWGGWTAKELYVIAKMATYYARLGVWECTSDGEVDTYGRMLVECPQLREDLLRLGMAHILNIDDEPGAPSLLKAQHEAQANRRGIWAHGIPAFIVTSLHSAEEDVKGHGTYNRLVSSDDGHSVKWKHTSRYTECSKVCQQVYAVHDDKVDAVAKTLRDDVNVAAIIQHLSDPDLRSVVHDFAMYRHINRKVDKDQREALKARLMTYATDGSLGEQTGAAASCMTHVPFERRFGTGRAVCLK
ncbi:MAG: thermonuclease family protein [Nannocystaceae bacterium]|nr:thermonuclease family protein [Nannocystaceae bacterium]